MTDIKAAKRLRIVLSVLFAIIVGCAGLIVSAGLWLVSDPVGGGGPGSGEGLREDYRGQAVVVFVATVVVASIPFWSILALRKKK